jgi:Na+/glutamate symporter
MRNLGNVLGVAVASTILSAQTALYMAELSERGVSGPALQTQAFLGGFHDAFLVAALFATFGLVASLTRGAPGPKPQTATR